MTKKQAEQKARRMMSSVHILIAVVAIIECILLTTFTTFSWIESNSSLVIENGLESPKDTQRTLMKISSRLTKTFDLDTAEGSTFLELKDFFSEVKYFEFAKTTSADGKTFFFPYRNNTYLSATRYRRGDTIDYNTSYLYFDFVLSNKGENAENRDVYFSPGDFAGIFSVDGVSDPTSIEDTQKRALLYAMRMSITTQSGLNDPSTTIYAVRKYSDDTSNRDAEPYSSISADAVGASVDPSTTPEILTSVSTERLSDYVYAVGLDGAVTSKKLFEARKNADIKVSVRIWFDWMDPSFQEAYSITTGGTGVFSSAAYQSIPEATIGVKFAFETSGNDLCNLSFDDYTFSNAAGKAHLTDENDDYTVWFYAYQPQVAASADHPARTASYCSIPLEADRSDPTHTRWSTNQATKSMMECLMNAGDHANAALNGANQYQYTYFCYGDYSTKTAVYRWALPAAPAVEQDFVFSAYSYLPNSSEENDTAWVATYPNTTYQDCNGTWRTGVGLWRDDDTYTTLTLLQFRDRTTAVTDQDYNRAGYVETVLTQPNTQIMDFAAAADDHAHYLLYVNNVNSNTLANNFGSTAVAQMVTIQAGETPVTTTINGTVEGITAAMYYDAAAGVFKSYVPTYWLTGDGAATPVHKGVSFTYCPSGTFSLNKATIRWYNVAPASRSGAYIYTALGYSASALTGIGYLPGYYADTDGFFPGVGTWSDVEEIRFSTELIDTDLRSAYRYFVGITDANSCGYYAMVPDAVGMTFSAYVPAGLGSDSPAINFTRYAACKTSASDAAPTAYWYGNTRGTQSTFYPVSIVSTPAEPIVYTRGYWNISVLVDATYENLIYETLTDGAAASYTVTSSTNPSDADNDIIYYSNRVNYGKLEYSYDQSVWTTIFDDTDNTATQNLDTYRFYANAEGHDTVYWRWTPYAGYTLTGVKVGGVTKDIIAPATEFIYTHSLSDGIYLVVTEAPNAVSMVTPEP